MAIVRLSEPYLKLTGKICKSDNVYFQHRNGKTILCRSPKHRPRKLSPSEIERRAIFAAVSKEATEILKDPVKRKNAEVMWKKYGGKKFCTLRGFVLSELYALTEKELRSAKNEEN